MWCGRRPGVSDRSKIDLLLGRVRPTQAVVSSPVPSRTTPRRVPCSSRRRRQASSLRPSPSPRAALTKARMSVAPPSGAGCPLSTRAPPKPARPRSTERGSFAPSTAARRPACHRARKPATPS
jgi:hypothetical protein